MDRLLYDKPRAAEILSIGVRGLEELIRKGEVESVKIGQRRLVPDEALRDYVKRLREAA